MGLTTQPQAAHMILVPQSILPMLKDIKGIWRVRHPNKTKANPSLYQDLLCMNFFIIIVPVSLNLCFYGRFVNTIREFSGILVERQAGDKIIYIGWVGMTGGGGRRIILPITKTCR